jgi:hypothetical protein
MDPPESFETKLRSMRLRQPSEHLGERILSARQAPIGANRSVWQVPLMVAASVSLLMLASGFAAGLWTGGAWRGALETATARSGVQTPIDLVVDHPAYSETYAGVRWCSTVNPFDFTRTAVEFIAGPEQAVVQFSGGDDL